MTYITVKLVDCLSCGYRFSARDEDGRVAKGLRKVLGLLAKVKQVCPKCLREYAPGALMFPEDAALLATFIEEEQRPKKVVKCSKCGIEGHNKLGCGRPTQGKVYDDDEWEEEDDLEEMGRRWVRDNENSNGPDDNY